jgi:hypothetical protein
MARGLDPAGSRTAGPAKAKGSEDDQERPTAGLPVSVLVLRALKIGALPQVVYGAVHRRHRPVIGWRPPYADSVSCDPPGDGVFAGTAGAAVGPQGSHGW